MKTRTIVSIGLSVMAFTVAGQGLASAGDREAEKIARRAEADAGRATRALADRDGDAAVVHAESAVALAPQSAAYRMLLARSYLRAGRFTSAARAFGDVLSLRPGDDRAALNLALAQVATGEPAAARATIEAHPGIAPADRGLAIALAGDPAAGAALLLAVARTPAADATVRQNLALALALAGDWRGARIVAATDLSPADVDRRLEQWAAFAQPRAASDQVATLLGVRAALDPGQPTQLALVAPSPAIAIAPVVAAPNITPPNIAEVAVEAPEAPAAPVAIVFGPRQEVVQRLPGAMPVQVAASRRRVQVVPPVTRLARRAVPVAGNYYVQIGAFDNVAVARDAWQRFARRHAAFADRVPNGALVKTGGANLYRLSIGGYARTDADWLCRQYRARGGACFVRAAAGDRSVAWAAPARMQMAAR